ncbi:SPOR domain-containing protein [Pseudoalteromonas fenneropenaei]|uniref:SPOR domain-containing protein n=1 Tax=Pseudoalteromonas fenneropenaei TaxID=1737459 RepID=A0ABV7CNG1_9GAMM
MNSAFVNRLVGTCIVVVAAVVFIPNILDGEKVHHQETFPAIPDRPEFTTIDLQAEVDAKADAAKAPNEVAIEDETALDADGKDFVAALNEPVDDGVTTTSEEQAQATTENLSDATVPQPEVKPIMPEVKRPSTRNSNLDKSAYVIQLGSFSHKANVDALVKKLRDNGFDTFTKPVQTPNGTLTKVFVGPTTDKAALESKLLELKKLTKLNGRLTEFEAAK